MVGHSNTHLGWYTHHVIMIVWLDVYACVCRKERKRDRVLVVLSLVYVYVWTRDSLCLCLGYRSCVTNLRLQTEGSSYALNLLWNLCSSNLDEYTILAKIVVSVSSRIFSNLVQWKRFKMPCWILRQHSQFHYSTCINKTNVVRYLVYIKDNLINNVIYW